MWDAPFSGMMWDESCGGGPAISDEMQLRVVGLHMVRLVLIRLYVKIGITSKAGGQHHNHGYQRV